MGRDDWYRNTHWDSATEIAFRTRLARSRTARPQYLRIQASYLTQNSPKTALQLIEEYFETGVHFDVSSAFCTRAEANLALGKKGEAVAAYKQALAWEEEHPRVISAARVDLPLLIAVDRLSDNYDYALHILTTRFKPMDHRFPITRYKWNGTCALIMHEQGQVAEAKELAERALRAAMETESPFRYHRNIGLVRNTADDFGKRLKRIAGPSRARALLRLILGR